MTQHLVYNEDIKSKDLYSILPNSEKVFQYSVITCLEYTLCDIFLHENMATMNLIIAK
jgi:hypothetical protein